MSGYTATKNGNKIVLEADTAQADPNKSAIMGATSGFGGGKAVSEVTKGVSTVTAAQGVTTAKVKAEDLKVGDQITIGGRKFELIAAGDTAQTGNVGIEWDSTKTLADLVTALDGGMDDVTVAATAAGDGFTVTQDVAGTGEYLSLIHIYDKGNQFRIYEARQPAGCRH